MFQQYFRKRLRRRRSRGLGSLLAALALAIGGYLVLEPTERRQAGVPEIVDGDSLHLSGLSIRLKGVDAPEMKQVCQRSGRPYRCGEVAKEALARKIGNGPVECRLAGRDRYRRSLAFCSVGGEDLGAWLVEEGLAVGYGDYEREEARARERRAGLWAGSFERPNEWRRDHRP
jgi:endonuclease YncB( thermonuclease family)